MTFGIGFDVSKAGDDGETLAQILYVSLHFLLVACGTFPLSFISTSSISSALSGTGAST